MRIPVGVGLGIAVLLAGPAAAIPLSISASTQQQLGWSSSSRRLRSINVEATLGTAGRNIRPADGGSSFALYGTPFVPDNPNDSFDYSSTNRESTTKSRSTTSTFTLYGTQSGTRQTTSPPPLGFFETGNSVFP